MSGGVTSRLGLLLAGAGLALAIWVIAAQDITAIGALLAGAGLGLLLLAPAHLPFMVANAFAWAAVMPRHQRPGPAGMLELVWIRETINTLLPVGQVGGEVACYRLMRRQGLRPGPAAGGVLLDKALSVLSTLGFALLGLAVLLAEGKQLGWGLVLGLILGGALLAGPFIALQNARAFGRVAAWLNRVTSGRMSGFLEHSCRIDLYLRRAWRRPRRLALCFAWQMAANILGALPLWLALWLLGHPVGFLEAMVIGALVQAVTAFAFAVPGGLGVIEAGFIGAGALVGVDPTAAAALALTRRLRELLVYLPGLAAWAWAERRAPVAERGPRPTSARPLLRQPA